MDFGLKFVLNLLFLQICPKIQVAFFLCYDEFFICLIICTNLYTFEVYVFKISALKLHKMTKILTPKHTVLNSKHPV